MNLSKLSQKQILREFLIPKPKVNLMETVWLSPSRFFMQKYISSLFFNK